MMKYDLTGKLAVVTGGSRGIGLAIAKALHEIGAKVVITARHVEAPDPFIPIICDHRDPKSIEEMAAQVLEKEGTPDILVNNAGAWKHQSVVEMSLEDWNSIIDLNLTGTFLTTKAFLPKMIEKNRGDIFMISSMSGKKGDPNSSAYAASKFGLQGFSQALNHEVRKNNIRVMVLNPSQVDKSEDTGPDYGPGLHLHANDALIDRSAE